jgi:hypothetical protein
MSRLLDSYSLLHSHNQFAKTLPLDISSDIENQRNIVTHQISRWKNKQAHQEVLDKLTQLQLAHDEYNLAVSKLQDNIKSVISNKERRIIQRDYARYYNPSIKHDDVDQIISRQEYISNDFEDQVIGVMQQYVAWQYPNLEVNPADGRYSSIMSAATPQYAICPTKELGEILKSKFNKFYATRRLRIYDSISDIPINQIGFATCINMFEYMPLDPIKDITKQVFDCLRPGGMFLLSYNNCNHARSLDLLNNDFRCLNTKELMESLVFGQGFDVIKTGSSKVPGSRPDTYNIDGTWTWLLVSKPGARSTQRLSAGDATIIEKIYPWEGMPIEIQKWVMSHKATTSEEWMETLARDFENQWERTSVDWSHLGTSGANVWKKYSNSIKIYIASIF